MQAATIRFLFVFLSMLTLPALAGTAADEVNVIDPWVREVPL